jgi:hypothetical protein
MILRADVGVRLGLAIDSVSVVASENLGGLLDSSLVLAEVSFVALGTVCAFLQPSFGAVISIKTRILTREFSVERAVESTRAGLEGCRIESITVFTYRASFTYGLTSQRLVGTGFTVNLVDNPSGTLITFRAFKEGADFSSLGAVETSATTRRRYNCESQTVTDRTSRTLFTVRLLDGSLRSGVSSLGALLLSNSTKRAVMTRITVILNNLVSCND